MVLLQSLERIDLKNGIIQHQKEVLLVLLLKRQLLENDSADGQVQYFINEDYSIQEQSGYADNLDLDKEAGFDTASAQDDILDFTERNPFGDPDGGGF